MQVALRKSPRLFLLVNGLVSVFLVLFFLQAQSAATLSTGNAQTAQAPNIQDLLEINRRRLAQQLGIKGETELINPTNPAYQLNQDGQLGPRLAQQRSLASTENKQQRNPGQSQAPQAAQIPQRMQAVFEDTSLATLMSSPLFYDELTPQGVQALETQAALTGVAAAVGARSDSLSAADQQALISQVKKESKAFQRLREFEISGLSAEEFAEQKGTDYWSERVKLANAQRTHGETWDRQASQFNQLRGGEAEDFAEFSGRERPEVDDDGLKWNENTGSYEKIKKKSGGLFGGWFGTILGLIVAIAVTIGTKGLASSFLGKIWGTIAQGALIGASSTFTTSLVNTGSLTEALKAAAVGAVTGAATAGLIKGVGQIVNKIPGMTPVTQFLGEKWTSLGDFIKQPVTNTASFLKTTAATGAREFLRSLGHNTVSTLANKVVYGKGTVSGWIKNLIKGSAIAGVSAMGVFAVAHFPPLERLWESEALGSFEVDVVETDSMVRKNKVTGVALLGKGAAHAAVQGAIAEVTGGDAKSAAIGAGFGNVISSFSTPITLKLTGGLSKGLSATVQQHLQRLIVQESTKAIAAAVGADPLAAAAAAWRIALYNHELEKRGNDVYVKLEKEGKFYNPFSWHDPDIREFYVGKYGTEWIDGKERAFLHLDKSIINRMLGNRPAYLGPAGTKIDWELAHHNIDELHRNFGDKEFTEGGFDVAVLQAFQYAELGKKLEINSLFVETVNSLAEGTSVGVKNIINAYSNKAQEYLSVIDDINEFKEDPVAFIRNKKDEIQKAKDTIKLLMSNPDARALVAAQMKEEFVQSLESGEFFAFIAAEATDSILTAGFGKIKTIQRILDKAQEAGGFALAAKALDKVEFQGGKKKGGDGDGPSSSTNSSNNNTASSGGSNTKGSGSETIVTLSNKGVTWTKTNTLGRSVYKNNSAFDPNRIDTKGRTNIQRMEERLAPIGHDGKSVELHHMTQGEVNSFNGTRGSLAEVQSDFHKKNYDAIHIYGRNHPDYISWRKTNPQAAKEFDTFRKKYWQERSKDFK